MISKIKKFVLLLLLITLSQEGFTQFGSSGLTNARNNGMANTYTANSYGLFSVGLNPGLLSKFPGDEEISILFPSLTARGYGVQKTLQTFNYYGGIFDRGSINRLTAEEFLATLQEDGTLGLSAVIGFFSIGYQPSEEIGTFAFSITDYIAAYLHFPGFVVDALNEETPLSYSVNLDDFVYKTWWIRSYAISYSRRLFHDPGGKVLRAINGGASLKYFNGFVYQDITINASVATSSEDTLFAASFDAQSRNSFSSDLTFMNPFIEDGNTPDNYLFPKAAAKRMGFDIGFSAELNRGITIGLAVTDIGKLNWQDNAGKREIQASFAILGDLDENLIDSIASDAYVSAREDDEFTISLPTAFRAGIALQFDEMFTKFPGRMQLAFDFNKGFNNEPSNFTKARYSAGLDYQPARKAPIILTGITTNENKQIEWAFGLGYNIKVMEVYISTIDMHSLVQGSKYFSISAIFNWKINFRE
jgi:hypothetical protein